MGKTRPCWFAGVEQGATFVFVPVCPAEGWDTMGHSRGRCLAVHTVICLCISLKAGCVAGVWQGEKPTGDAAGSTVHLLQVDGHSLPSREGRIQILVMETEPPGLLFLQGFASEDPTSLLTSKPVG